MAGKVTEVFPDADDNTKGAVNNHETNEITGSRICSLLS
jgi:hypothetical protein